MNDSKNYGCSVGFSSMLTIVFVILKLCNVISWSWLWVLSPLWIDLAFTLIVIVIYAIYLVHEDKKGYSIHTRRKKDKWKF